MESTAPFRQSSRVLLLADALRSSGSLRIRALGTSMLPSIWPGDILNIEPCQPVEVNIGDIVVVIRGDGLLAHRVVATTETAGGVHWITRGDAMPQADQAGESELLGKVANIERAGQTIVPGRKRSSLNRALGHALSRSRRLLNCVLWLRQTFRPELRDEIAAGVSAW